MDIDDYTKKEREFLKEIDIPCNEHGDYIFISADKKVSLDLAFILLEETPPLFTFLEGSGNF